MGQEYLTDSPDERIAKYRSMAAEARESAYNAKTQESCDAYMAIAAAWDDMAVELQHAEEFKERLLGLSGTPSKRETPDP